MSTPAQHYDEIALAIHDELGLYDPHKQTAAFNAVRGISARLCDRFGDSPDFSYRRFLALCLKGRES